MSGSKYEYVRAYERPDGMLGNTFLLLRIDGHAFHKCVRERAPSGRRTPVKIPSTVSCLAGRSSVGLGLPPLLTSSSHNRRWLAP